MGRPFHQWGLDHDPFDLREGLWDDRIPLDPPEELAAALAGRPADAESLCQLAEACRQYGQADKALEAALQALALDPSNFNALALKGMLLRERGDFPAALEAFERARDVQPSSVEVNLQIGRIHFLRRDFESARQALSRVLADQPLHHEAHLLTLQAFLKEAHLDGAVEWLRAQVVERPRYAELRYRLGMLLASRGILGQAIEQFRTAVEISPLYREARWKLAQALFFSGRFQEAELSLKEFIADYPDHAESHYCLARLLHAQGATDLAQAAFERTLNIDPHFTAAHRDLAFLLEAIGQPDAALRHMERLAELRPTDPDAPFLLSQILARHGQHGPALDVIEAGLRRMPDDPTLAHQRGILLLRLGRADEAREAFDQAARACPELKKTQDRLLEIHVRKSPGPGRALFAFPTGPTTRAEMFRRFELLGESGQESRILEILERLGPRRDESEFVFHRAMAEAQRNAPETAVDILKSALLRDEGNPRILYWLGTCLAAMGRFNGSTQAYEAAIEEDPMYVYVHENQGFAFGQTDSSPSCPCADYIAVVCQNADSNHLENRAVEHFNRGRFYFGIRELKAAVRNDPDNPRIHHRLAVAHFDAFQSDEAEQETGFALAASPGYCRSHALLALLAERRGDLSFARRQWERFLCFCPQPRWKIKALDRLQTLAS